ncbi:uncharacterized protein CEXT_22821 [Caerostris extrusa]|uniref:Uncharacterized protein n=1 Tax=Caerostris extrusa TaxID=172846 RepID=A0AAV4XXA2_CAEEX|nr:uncharacterized protein CEXT_22821 [Caerostris extrusa]
MTWQYTFFLSGVWPDDQLASCEYTGRFGWSCPEPNRRNLAGFPSKGPPECQDKEYDDSDGILPSFRGESTSHLIHRPQPPVKQLRSYKPIPGSEKPPMIMGPGSMEVESMHRASYQPQPTDLTRVTTRQIWMKDRFDLTEYQPRYDMTTSYQADYCCERMKPRDICLEWRAGGDDGGSKQQLVWHETAPVSEVQMSNFLEASTIDSTPT